MDWSCPLRRQFSASNASLMRPPQRRPVRSLPGSSDRVLEGWMGAVPGAEANRRVESCTAGAAGSGSAHHAAAGWRSCARSRRRATSTHVESIYRGVRAWVSSGLAGRARGIAAWAGCDARRRPPGRPPIGRPSHRRGRRRSAHREPGRSRSTSVPGVAPPGRSLGGDQSNVCASRTWTPSRRSERVPVGGYCLATCVVALVVDSLGCPCAT